MAFAQPGIFAVGTRSHLHVEFDVDDPQAAAAAVHRVRDAATGVVGVNLVVGFGPRMWSALAPEQMPTGFTDFEPIVGAGGYTIPGGQHDLWLWAHGTGADGVFDVARHAALELEASGRVATEQASFVYRASQDLTGFEDGTENPPLGEAMGVATIPEGDPCAGGSVVLLQRWVRRVQCRSRPSGRDARPYGRCRRRRARQPHRVLGPDRERLVRGPARRPPRSRVTRETDLDA